MAPNLLERRFDGWQPNKAWVADITFPLDVGESKVFARAALALKYDDPEKPAPPITASQVLTPRHLDDRRADLWSVF